MRRPETEVDLATIESTTEIRPFSVEVPEEDLVDLRERIAARRWPDEGNHFAAWQEPELFTQELRAAFRPLRTTNDQGRSP